MSIHNSKYSYFENMMKNWQILPKNIFSTLNHNQNGKKAQHNFMGYLPRLSHVSSKLQMTNIYHYHISLILNAQYEDLTICWVTYIINLQIMLKNNCGQWVFNPTMRWWFTILKIERKKPIILWFCKWNSHKLPLKH